MPTLAKIIFVLAFTLSLTGLLSPPVALTVGIIFGLSFPHPYINESCGIARTLLQSSVVALGFGMNLHEVLKAGRSGFIYTAMGISFALLAGLALGKLLQVRGNSSFLITTGTAICGGSAIAAIGPILQANEEEMAVSLGTIFILNSVALLIWKLVSSFTIAIRTVGRAGDPRHQLRSRRRNEIWPPGPGDRHHSKTRPRVLDRSASARNCRDQAEALAECRRGREQHASHPDALVYRILCSRRGSLYVSARVRTAR